eukprot:c20575_g1_i1 orf=314-1714(+)
MTDMEAHATASVIEEAASVDEYTMRAPSLQAEPTHADEHATNMQNTIHITTSSMQNMTHHIVPSSQNTNFNSSPLHEVTPIQMNLGSLPSQTPLLLTFNNSKEEPCVQEPSKEIVKAVVDEDGKKRLANLESPRVLPCVGAFTVQCALCMKWRLIPTKEQYEEIRQSVLEKPFFCSSARSWRPDASCEDPSDVSQDESHLWAIDRPNIPVAPRGWERQLVIRAAGASKFADVYYVAPSGRKLRSMPEVERFLAEFPEYVQAGVKQSQFSFIIPRPLDSNYCRKKTPAPSSPSANGSDSQKQLSKSKKSQGIKLSAKRKAFESLSSKEGSEELAGTKKSSGGAIVVGKFEKGPGEDRSYDSLISQQVVKGSLPPEELMKGLLWGFNVPNSGNPDHASAPVISQEGPTLSNRAEAALQDPHSHDNNHCEIFSAGASSLGIEKNASRELVPVYATPSTIMSSLQERPTS